MSFALFAKKWEDGVYADYYAAPKTVDGNTSTYESYQKTDSVSVGVSCVQWFPTTPGGTITATFIIGYRVYGSVYLECAYTADNSFPASGAWIAAPGFSIPTLSPHAGLTPETVSYTKSGSVFYNWWRLSVADTPLMGSALLEPAVYEATFYDGGGPYPSGNYLNINRRRCMPIDW